MNQQQQQDGQQTEKLLDMSPQVGKLNALVNDLIQQLTRSGFNSAAESVAEHSGQVFRALGQIEEGCNQVFEAQKQKLDEQADRLREINEENARYAQFLQEIGHPREEFEEFAAKFGEANPE